VAIDAKCAKGFLLLLVPLCLGGDVLFCQASKRKANNILTHKDSVPGPVDKLQKFGLHVKIIFVPFCFYFERNIQ